MSGHYLSVRNVYRIRNGGSVEELSFKDGINLIIGPSNSGKTTWLMTIDYLLGDTASTKDGLPTYIANDYRELGASIVIDGTEHHISRAWESPRGVSDIIFDGIAFKPEDFQSVLMDRLRIPELWTPKGNPYDPRTWPKLSWRQLLRHIYRRQDSWADIAAKQPEGDQRHCLLEFVGLAEQYFPIELTKLPQIEIRRTQLLELRSKVDYAAKALLSDVAINRVVASNSITPSLIQNLKGQVQSDIDSLRDKRDALLRQPPSKDDADESALENEKKRISLEKDKSRLDRVWQQLIADESAIASRVKEVQEYGKTIQREMERLRRARISGDVLGAIKITHCPACDQPVKQTNSQDSCFLCHQLLRKHDANQIDADNRIRVEVSLLNEEAKENQELLATLTNERRMKQDKLAEIELTLATVSLALGRHSKPSEILPRDLLAIEGLDVEIGIRVARLKRLADAEAELKRAEGLDQELNQLDAEASALRNRYDTATNTTKTETTGGYLDAGLYQYFSKLPSPRRESWTARKFSTYLSRDKVEFFVDGRPWSSALGATQRMYFFVAYQYALLSLTEKSGCHYPGLSIMDFPPEFVGQELKDKENFVIEPFIDIVNQKNEFKPQIIVTGHAFDGFNGHRIVLKDKY